MAVFIRDASFDTALNDIKNNADFMHVLSAYTLGDNYATVTGNSLGSVAVDTGDFTGPADGDTSGRKLTVTAQVITATGTDASPDLHVALVDSGSTAVLVVTDETTDQAVTTSDVLNVPAFDIEIADAT